MERYDLVVVGGGMAGLSLIAAIQPAIEQGLNVALIDPAPMPETAEPGSPSFDDRATALSAQALQTFTQLGLSGLEDAISNITHIEVSDRGHAGFHELNATEQGLERFGAVIANRRLGQLLWQRVHSIDVHWHFDQQVNQISAQQNGHTLTLANGQQLSAALVVLCDGGRSQLHQQLALPEQQFNFNAHARVATVATSVPHQGRAFERFTEYGPIALLPFGKYSALVWTIPEDAPQSLPDDPTKALAWLNEHFGQRLGSLTDIGSWQEYPLTEKQMPITVSHGFIALGNAAATLHPVAGQGFNLAIRGISKTAAVINQHFARDKRLPDFNALNALAANIQTDQQLTAGFSRELIRLFGARSPVLQLARGIGLSAMDRHPLLSKSFALAGMGLLQQPPAQRTVY